MYAEVVKAAKPVPAVTSTAKIASAAAPGLEIRTVFP
jgi:hypothetical protein